MSYCLLRQLFLKNISTISTTSKSVVIINRYYTSPGDTSTRKPLLQELASTFTTKRLDKMTNVVNNRTRNIAVVLEKIRNEGNEYAIYRTMDALGYQVAHKIPNPKYSRRTCSRTDAGAMKWIDIKTWKSAKECLSQLKSCKYNIVAASSKCGTKNLQSLDFTRKTAIILGSENEGVSEEAMSFVDEVFHIDMVGFVESYNVSVAAALILHHIHQDRITKLVRSSEYLSARIYVGSSCHELIINLIVMLQINN